MAVGGAGGIVELLEETIQACLIAQRENDVDAHRLCFGEAADELRLPFEICFTDMVRHQGLRTRLALHHEEKNGSAQQYVDSETNWHSMILFGLIHYCLLRPSRLGNLLLERG